MNNEKARIVALREEVDKKWEQYCKAEKALLDEPTFIDKAVLKNFDRAKQEWQLAINAHNNYLTHLRDIGFFNNQND